MTAPSPMTTRPPPKALRTKIAAKASPTRSLPAWFDLVAEIRAGLNAAKTKTYFAELDAKFTNARAGLPDDVIAELDKLSAAARKRVANSEV